MLLIFIFIFYIMRFGSFPCLPECLSKLCLNDIRDVSLINLIFCQYARFIVFVLLSLCFLDVVRRTEVVERGDG